VLLDLFEPVNGVHEGLVSGDIVGEEDAVSSSVENPGHTLEGLLAGGIPYLKLDDFILDRPSERTEFHSDGNLMFSLELIVLHSAHQATLTDTSVSDYNQLEKVILSGERLILDDVKRHRFQVLNLILVHFKSINILNYPHIKPDSMPCLVPWIIRL
jgi:hypothetical protein